MSLVKKSIAFDKLNSLSICILGLGYVGLPLAIEFSKKFRVVGYDKDINRIKSLKKGKDINNDINFKINKNIFFTSNDTDIKICNIFIIAVPTPIKKNFQPDLNPIKSASKTVGKILKKGDIVIFESTVYPGCTENDCVPIISNFSNLQPNTDFFYGYSPERINPGDKKHTLVKIKKVVSASNIKTLNLISNLYSSIIKAGIHKTKTIKIAEAAKVIENTQRDLNIAFMNELSKIFFHLDIEIKEVLEAAKTKWNFLDFKPGLVGGHCIGVDPYYLTHISKKKGYMPNFVISGRTINNNMPKFIVDRIINLLKKQKIKGKVNAFIAGLTFKEDVSDLRNSKVFEIISLLIKKNIKVSIFDPLINKSELPSFSKKLFKENMIYKKLKTDIFILAVSHNNMLNKINKNINKIKSNNKNLILVDLTSKLSVKADITF
tara:strand:- start:5281 stop:6582 length:1302 start_codon:yes stop_codon:yes gene_type:complete